MKTFISIVTLTFLLFQDGVVGSKDGAWRQPTSYLAQSSKPTSSTPYGRNDDAFGSAEGISRGGARVVNIKRRAKKVEEVGNPGASVTASVFNLVNNVAGAGILALAAGMTGGTGWIPACLISGTLGILSAHTFKIIGEACQITGELDFKGLWSKTIGPKTTYVVDGLIAIMCLAVSTIYAGILGDVFTPLLEQAGLPAQYNGRTSNILAIVSVILFPLCLIKDLSALAFTSLMGFAAIMYTVCFVAIRAFDGSYKLGAGKFVVDGVLEKLPAFEKTSLWGFGFTSLVLASNLGLAYVSHYNAPNFYRQLQNRSPKRFARVVDISFFILVNLYILMMVTGYSTFGDVCRGNILLSYHPGDWMAKLGQVATGFSILFGFPLVFSGAREGIVGALSSVGFPQIAEEKNHVLTVLAIITFVTSIAITVKDVSIVVGLTGAALGAFIVYICPSIIYANAIKISKGADSPEYAKAKWNLAMVPFGMFIACTGVYMTLKEAMA